MKAEGIYVEISIAAPLDELWEYTQNPHLHQQWDLRFTTIEYLPKTSATEPQRFRYATRIGFGLHIAGEGESTGMRSPVDPPGTVQQETTRPATTGPWTSALKFWSDQPLSLIQSGSGYWQYIPQGTTVRFLTRYDYQVRFGALGGLFDRTIFRPLMGWATAWSFDALRLWLEQGIHPEYTLRRMGMHLAAQLALATIWIYQGLVPKLLFPHRGELEILRATGLFAGPFTGVEENALFAIGTGQIIFGLLFLAFGGQKWLHYVNILALLALGLAAFGSTPALFVAPFNPPTLTLAMVTLSLISLLNAKDLPRAGNCRRQPRAQ